jgi:hypothetical protein
MSPKEKVMKAKVLLTALLICALVLPCLAAEKRIEIDLTGRPFLGPGNAPVTIVEFLDFQ